GRQYQLILMSHILFTIPCIGVHRYFSGPYRYHNFLLILVGTNHKTGSQHLGRQLTCVYNEGSPDVAGYIKKSLTFQEYLALQLTERLQDGETTSRQEDDRAAIW